MKSSFYIERTLKINDENIYSEKDLIDLSESVIVLSEPGAGKSELLNSLACKLGVKVETANVLLYREPKKSGSIVIVDGVDEIANTGSDSINKLFANITACNPSRIILSSRSSEWDDSLTHRFKNFTGSEPLVLWLKEFDSEEQKNIYFNHTGKSDFSLFFAKIAEFDLDVLLPNPQFLKMFADAYNISGGDLKNKKSIFQLAIEKQASESNISIKPNPLGLTLEQKINLSSEVFAKLLLSGVEGISTSEIVNDDLYPMLSSLFMDINQNPHYQDILSTQLFRPAYKESLHRPVHKIIAEYCAATYLIKKIQDSNHVLTLSKCLSIISPNNIARYDLRGLLGWMATLGSRTIQEKIIDIDPYAVLANGDPSELEHSSKLRLINNLKILEEKDPHFRRGDYWRSFSVVGFFTADMAKVLKSILNTDQDNDLRELMLELITNSEIIELLIPELYELILDSEQSEYTRLKALQCLLFKWSERLNGIVGPLMFEASKTSLRLIAQVVKYIGVSEFPSDFISRFLSICSKFYDQDDGLYDREIGSRYFIKDFIANFPISITEAQLNELSSNIACNCQKERYACECSIGISKIIGLLLDRYFELAEAPFDVKNLWRWIVNLNFKSQKSCERSKAVQVLQENIELRTQIFEYVFSRCPNRKDIHNTYIKYFSNNRSHSGLTICLSDYDYFINYAFDKNNITLWGYFFISHKYSTNSDEYKKHNQLRKLMRQQALLKPDFMKEWASMSRSIFSKELSEFNKKEIKHRRRIKRQDSLAEKKNQKDLNFFKINYLEIEQGLHWDFLVMLAEYTLYAPSEIETKFGTEVIVRSVLRNCLKFLLSKIPDINEQVMRIGDLKYRTSQSKYRNSEIVLCAACLEYYKYKGNLEDVPIDYLIVLHEYLFRFGGNIADNTINALKAEVQRLCFSTEESCKKYLEQYIEPKLANGFAFEYRYLLRKETVFSKVGQELAIVWLEKYRNLPLNVLNELFNIVAEYGDRNKLKEIIKNYCKEVMKEFNQLENNQMLNEIQKFWLIREFYFIDDISKKYMEIIQVDKCNLFDFVKISGRFVGQDYNIWPKLTANKIYAILDAFYEQWPQVPLPSAYGSGSPPSESAYRFLTGLIWLLISDNSDNVLPIINKMLEEPRFYNLHRDLKGISASVTQKSLLNSIQIPTPQEVKNLLEYDEVINVNLLRNLVLEELNNLQQDINGSEFNTIERFYSNSGRLDENSCTEIIAERLYLRLKHRNIIITPEHDLKNHKRSDFTVTKIVEGNRFLLVTEVKGQWNRALYTAGSDQLAKYYTIHPDANNQGIYLVLWFGKDESVAGKKNHNIESSVDLKNNLESRLDPQLKGLIDIFVLDLSKNDDS